MLSFLSLYQKRETFGILRLRKSRFRFRDLGHGTSVLVLPLLVCAGGGRGGGRDALEWGGGTPV